MKNISMDDYYDSICSTCGGEGQLLAECFEDSCCCADPEEHGYITCPVCGGSGE
jgi:hypothetical protein